MGFNVLAIRSGDDTGDDALHPLLSDASRPELIAMDRYDGPNVARTVATSVSVLQVRGDRLKQLVRLTDVRVDVYVTDGRLAIACQKYDKGGGWVGFGGAGLLIALTANAVSKARAASRSRGKVLVGHVRYPWLKAVGATSRTSFLSPEAIRLEFAQKMTTGVVHLVLQLTFPKNTDATQVAQDVIRRSASYRLAHYPDMDAETRAKFVHLRHAPPRLQPQPGKFAIQQMPNYYFAGNRTAFPGSPQSRTPVGRTDESVRVFTPAAPSAAARHVAAAVPRPARTVSFCTQCGTRREPGDNFCQECGAALDENDRHLGGGSVAAAWPDGHQADTGTAQPRKEMAAMPPHETASRSLGAISARKLIAMGLVVLAVIAAAIVGHAVASSNSIAVGDCVVTNPDVLTDWDIKKVACTSDPGSDLTVQRVVSVQNGSDNECDLDLTTFQDDPADKTYCLNGYLSDLDGG